MFEIIVAYSFQLANISTVDEKKKIKTRNKLIQCVDERRIPKEPQVHLKGIPKKKTKDP